MDIVMTICNIPNYIEFQCTINKIHYLNTRVQVFSGKDSIKKSSTRRDSIA